MPVLFELPGARRVEPRLELGDVEVSRGRRNIEAHHVAEQRGRQPVRIVAASVLVVVAEGRRLGAPQRRRRRVAEQPSEFIARFGAGTRLVHWGLAIPFVLLLLTVAHVFWRRGVDVRFGPRLARARSALRGAPGMVATVALVGDLAFLHDSSALIALAPQERRQIIDDCRAAGIEHYTLKPVRRGSLVERIRAALGTEPERAKPAPIAKAPAQQPLLGLRVLLAEDNPINALLARTLLTKAGCSVTSAQDGEEAVAAASAGAFDLILLDIRMPRLDGFEAAERIRAGRGPSAGAPIVALTADAGDEERAHAAKAGMDDFITKPIDANRLLQVAARFTERMDPQG